MEVLILSQGEPLHYTEVLLEMVWLAKGIPEKRNSVDDWTIGKLAISIAVPAGEGAEGCSRAPLNG